MQLVVVEFLQVASERNVVEREDEYLKQSVLKFPEQFARIGVDVALIPRALHVRHFVTTSVAINAGAEALRWVVSHEMHARAQGDVVSDAPVGTDRVGLPVVKVDQDAPRNGEGFE